MPKIALDAFIIGNLSQAMDIFTEAITADASNYIYYVYRATVYVRLGKWDAALEDVDQSIGIERSALGLMFKGIALYGKTLVKEASRAFDRALQLVTGDSATHLLFLIKAIATFNANEHDEALVHVKDMAETYHDSAADFLACSVVQIYFYAEMAFTAAQGNIRDKSIEYINAAFKIATACSLEKMDMSVYTEFDVIFGWNVKSLWQKINKYRCLILLRTCNIEALECYRTLMDSCDKAEKDSLIAWFAAYKGVKCMPCGSQKQLAAAATTSMNAEVEVKQASLEKVVETKVVGTKVVGTEVFGTEVVETKVIETKVVETEVVETNVEREKKVGSAADEKMQEKIKQAIERLPKDRKCANGYAWIQTSNGFKCAGGGHSISWEELEKLGGSEN
ncbi:uncharacterized protein EDB93DRAFT_833135 [Suillus bovinus]|uniref:uncharacterized protein n=1 Tax=Suillus bovinus TaxID=48563 RepID=UPI001B871604|nr:uncharacterized protein EDB93DRAFT_833135 [Suillus bovinus]KAG2135230.1 hypothetical protein EDB93DRAFT_833135 [Suillus bovinus]